MQRGVVVLALFPFTDLSGVKKRPALIVSRSDRSNDEAILAFIGTYRGQTLTPTDYLISSTHADFEATGFKQDSYVRLGKLITLDNSLLLGEIGEFSDDFMAQLSARLKHALELE